MNFKNANKAFVINYSDFLLVSLTAFKSGFRLFWNKYILFFL